MLKYINTSSKTLHFKLINFEAQNTKKCNKINGLAFNIYFKNTQKYVIIFSVF